MNETTLPCCESDFKVYLSAAARQRIPSRISRSRRGAYPRTTPVRHRGLMQKGSTVYSPTPAFRLAVHVRDPSAMPPLDPDKKMKPGTRPANFGSSAKLLGDSGHNRISPCGIRGVRAAKVTIKVVHSDEVCENQLFFPRCISRHAFARDRRRTGGGERSTRSKPRLRGASGRRFAEIGSAGCRCKQWCRRAAFGAYCWCSR